ncbi:hypothetical protein QR98_0024430 [Sarcoptes scabiei]|uniref:G-protein coupled receptors family 1 profile domain-containing protein n=1 Tax=Sarcoptes scabiei TaxID=52283 RepID=A0A131ZZ91_SARSC|nr:hypothetical protein QR98_0024430 [Sarcoptes scabiei]
MIEENRIRRSDRIAEDLNENCSSEIESDRNLDINAATISIKTVPPRIIIETSNESRQQSSNIISNKSELLSPFYPNTETDSEQQQQNQQQQEQHRRQRKQRPNFTKNGSPKNLRSIDKKIKKNNHSHHHHNLFKQQQKNHQYHFSCDVLDSKKHKIEPDEEEEEDEGGGQEGEERKLRRKNVKSRRSWKEDENDLESNNDDLESPTIKKPIRFETKSFLSAPKLLRSRFGSTLSIADYEDSDTVDDDKISLGKSRNRFDNNGSKNNNNYEINNGDRSPYHHHNPGHRSIHLPNDAERHKRKIAKARERRATLIVGLIMAAFIIAWLPFFVLYVLVALCQACKESTPQGIFSVAFWLGYGNSGE